MLLKHTLYNLLGLGLPLLAAIFTIPALLASLGEAQFGLLTLIWAVVSYFGLFDLGIGRVITQQISALLAKRQFLLIGPLITTATGIMALLGVIAGLIIAAFAEYGISLLSDIPNQTEAVDALYFMAIAMPFIVLTAGFRGILEAMNAFGVINAIRLPMGLFTFVGPLLVVTYWEPQLHLIAAVLTAGRITACIVHGYFAWKNMPNNHGPMLWRTSLIKPLCISGGWLTVSNIISPFMGYVDRFIIGAIVSASAVAYYATAHELATKLWIIPGALTAVLFPAFATQINQKDRNTLPLFRSAIYWLFFALFPITLALALFSRELLSAWINTDFAAQSSYLLQIFAFGILINCIAHIPFTLIQSADSAKVTALIHTAELPLFIIGVWWLTNQLGVMGAAIAWLMRMIVDTTAMFIASAPLIGCKATTLLDKKNVVCMFLALVCFTGITLNSAYSKIALLSFCTTISIAMLFFTKNRKLI